MNRGQNIVVALAALALAPLAEAGSLTNGNFDSNLNGWNLVDVNPAISATWVSEDSGGNSGSGAVELRDTNAGNGGTQTILEQCVDLAGASIPVPYQASAKVATEGEASVKAYLSIDEHNAPGCPPGSYIGLSISRLVNDSQATWQTYSNNFTPMAVETQAVFIRIGIQKAAGTGAGGSVRFDAVQFGVPGPELTRWTIDSGGGYLTGGNYVLQATVGQPDPGSASAGGTTLQSGFWFGAAAAPEDALFEDGFE